MRKVKVSEVDNLEHGDVIHEITGRLAKVWDYKTGEGQHGPYSYQNATLEDRGAKVTLTFSNMDDMIDSEGQTLTFRSSESKQYGWKGVSYQVAEKGGKTYKGIKVTNMSKITEVGSGEQPDRLRLQLGRRR
jgi:hypothetical protein